MKTFCFIVAVVIAVLFGVSIPSAPACTGIRIKPQDGSLIVARTMEFAADIESNVIVIPRQKDYVGTAPGNQPGLRWKSKYAVAGTNGFDMPAVVDGLNEKGLAVAIFYFPDYAKYQKVTKAEDAIAPWELPTFLLGTCANVKEAVEAVPKRSSGRGGTEGYGINAAVSLHGRRCEWAVRRLGIRQRRIERPRRSARRHHQRPILRLAPDEPT